MTDWAGRAENALSWSGQELNAPEAAALRVEQLRSLSKGQPTNMVLALSVVALLTITYWDVVGPQRVLIWSAAAVGASAWFLWNWWRRRDRALPKTIGQNLAKNATTKGFLYGLVWGSAGVLLFAPEYPVYQLLLLTILCGAAAAGAIMLAAVPMASIAYTVPVLLPFAVTSLLQQGTLDFALTAGAVVFGLTVTAAILRIQRGFLENARVRAANESLLEDLDATRADLMDVMTRAHEALAIFDANDRLVICNEAYQKFPHGRSINVMPGMPYEMLLREPVPPTFINGEEIAPEDYTDIRLQQRRTGKVLEQKRGDRWYMASDYPSRGGGTVSTYLDITDIKEREEALIQAKINAEYSSRAKSRFLALMSHELRTPLNAIIGFAEILETESFGAHSNPQYKEYAGSIHEAGAHLLNIINDILDLSKIEAGKMELQYEEIDVPSLIDDAVRYVRHSADRAGLNVVLDIPEDLPSLTADLRNVRQILLNLLSNAIKFSDSGGKVVVMAEAGNDGLYLQIKDQGVGIAAADLEKVLEPFGQAHSQITSHQRGTGLGLPLVRSMMRLHGGELHLESELGAGTTATLHFPPDRIAGEQIDTSRAP
jgi:signal transduction histidine kinase